MVLLGNCAESVLCTNNFLSCFFLFCVLWHIFYGIITHFSRCVCYNVLPDMLHCIITLHECLAMTFVVECFSFFIVMWLSCSCTCSWKSSCFTLLILIMILILQSVCILSRIYSFLYVFNGCKMDWLRHKKSIVKFGRVRALWCLRFF